LKRMPMSRQWASCGGRPTLIVARPTNGCPPRPSGRKRLAARRGDVIPGATPGTRPARTRRRVVRKGCCRWVVFQVEPVPTARSTWLVMRPSGSPIILTLITTLLPQIIIPLALAPSSTMGYAAARGPHRLCRCRPSFETPPTRFGQTYGSAFAVRRL
jgi:hypothetical protein